MPDSRIRRERAELDHRLPLIMRWYKGATLPPLGTQEIVWWEDTTNDTAKIAMRRSGRIYLFSAYETTTAVPVNISIAAHAHRHATAGSTLSDVGADPLGPYTFTWTGPHTFAPALATTTPIIIQAATGQSEPLFRIKAPL